MHSCRMLSREHQKAMCSRPVQRMRGTCCSRCRVEEGWNWMGHIACDWPTVHVGGCATPPRGALTEPPSPQFRIYRSQSRITTSPRYPAPDKWTQDIIPDRNYGCIHECKILSSFLKSTAIMSSCSAFDRKLMKHMYIAQSHPVHMALTGSRFLIPGRARWLALALDHHHPHI